MTMSMIRDTSSTTSSTINDVDGPVHVVSWDGDPATDTTYVLVHGLGGSHLNWSLFAPELISHGFVHAIDLPGFGKSEPGTRQASVQANVDVLVRFIERLGRPVVLVGNSMGGLISLLASVKRPDLVDGLVLLDPALPAPYVRIDPLSASLLSSMVVLYTRLGAKAVARMSLRHRVELMLRTMGLDLNDIPESLIEQSVALQEEREDVRGMDKALTVAAQSTVKMMLHPTHYRAAMRQVEVPVLLVHGDKDRVVPVMAARRAARENPTWEYLEMAGVGHTPQLQVPVDLATSVVSWLNTF